MNVRCFGVWGDSMMLIVWIMKWYFEPYFENLEFDFWHNRVWKEKEKNEERKFSEVLILIIKDKENIFASTFDLSFHDLRSINMFPSRCSKMILIFLDCKIYFRRDARKFVSATVLGDFMFLTLRGDRLCYVPGWPPGRSLRSRPSENGWPITLSTWYVHCPVFARDWAVDDRY